MLAEAVQAITVQYLLISMLDRHSLQKKIEHMRNQNYLLVMAGMLSACTAEQEVYQAYVYVESPVFY